MMRRRIQMKKIMVCLAVLLTVMMLGGSSWAFDGTNHVKLAPNGKGDLMFFPWYMAYPGGFETKITVINTSSTSSVVAKVVYRSYYWSQELLDHLIYLSPNDVWTGYLVYDKDGAYLESTDDSILSTTLGSTITEANFANIVSLKVPLGTPSCASDSNQMGYITVIEAASRVESVAATGYAPGAKVAKFDIANWYKALTNAQIANLYKPINVLAGYQENMLAVGSTMQRAVVFADYLNQFALSTAATTYLGDFANNTLAELEAAMAKANVALPYTADSNGDSTVHLFTFPTKDSLRNVASTCLKYAPNLESPYWTKVYPTSGQCETYSVNVYNLSEDTPKGSLWPFSPPLISATPTMCGEVQFNMMAVSNLAYVEGWMRYNWGQTAATKTGETKSLAPIAFTGTPVFANVLYWTDAGNVWQIADGAYDDGAVQVAGTALPYYQYSE